MDIQWFPGHMTKAKRLIVDQLGLVDVVCELRDARIPLASANPMLEELVKTKPRVIVLNKVDMADAALTQEWVAYYKSIGVIALPIDAITGKGFQQLKAAVREAAKPMMTKWTSKGLRPRAVRMMIIGIPNVGKSSLINKLVGKAKAKTGDKPGITKGKQWISLGNDIELLDTPGILWPKFDDPEAAFCLAATGAIKDEVLDREALALKLLEVLLRQASERLVKRYGITIDDETTPESTLTAIAVRRGCVRSGGGIDAEKAINIILKEFKSGNLGPLTLELPPAK